jgi:hypothetical protein
MPCVGANNTLSFPISFSSSSKATQISTSFAEDSHKLSQIPLMKFFIKLLHFFTLSSPSSDENQKGTQQHNNADDDVDFKRFNALPPFAYTTAMIFFIQLLSVIFVLNFEDISSPLVMFSYWRNKIS